MTSWKSNLEVIQALLKRVNLEPESTNRILKLLCNAVQVASNLEQWESLLRCWYQLPEKLFLIDAGTACAFVNTLRGSRNAVQCLEFSQIALLKFETPELMIEQAWALRVLERPFEALGLLEKALPMATGRYRVTAERLMGSVQHLLGMSDWEAHLKHAVHLCNGRDQALALLEYASCQLNDGQYHRARESLLQAKPLLLHDEYHLAWCAYSIGLTYLRANKVNGDPFFFGSG